MSAVLSSSTCPVCGGLGSERVLELSDVPANLNSQVGEHDAVNARKGQMEIRVCVTCTHLFNSAFDPGLIEYGAAYENTLHFSPRFRRHAEELARRLVSQHQLTGRLVIEVGCGPGHFLSLLCEAGAGKGLGFDPSYDPTRLGSPGHPGVSIANCPLSSANLVTADLACCLQVLEHLEAPLALLELLRLSVAGAGVVYCEVPNAELMVDQLAVWDLLYEHVSYFTPASLDVALARAGLTVDRGGTSFGDQFLWADARPGPVVGDQGLSVSAAERFVERALEFGRASRRRIDTAAEELDASLTDGPVVLWGAGTKGMTYLNLVEGAGRISAVVDLNPRKHGFGVPGTALCIGGPELLGELRPATVLIANPIYRDEIADQLVELGVRATLRCLWGDESFPGGG